VLSEESGGTRLEDRGLTFSASAIGVSDEDVQDEGRSQVVHLLLNITLTERCLERYRVFKWNEEEHMRLTL